MYFSPTAISLLIVGSSALMEGLIPCKDLGADEGEPPGIVVLVPRGDTWLLNKTFGGMFEPEEGC